MRSICTVARSLLFCLLLAIGIAACGGSGGGTTSTQTTTITIGATLPLSGALASVGVILKAAYQQAVNDANAGGGITFNGGKAKINLVLLDNASDPNTATSQATTLYLKDNAVALLGPFTPPLTIAVAQVAERLQRPFISTVTPIEAWLSGRPVGYKYSWNVFIDENDMSKLSYLTANEATTNKRVALFTDTEQDGIVEGKLWEQAATQYGYTVVYHASFAVGTTNFSSQIAAAKAVNAQVLIGQMIPPDAMALWKQIKSLNYHPVTAEIDKGASVSTWPQGLGASVAEGTLTNNFWSASLGYPNTSTLVADAIKAGHSNSGEQSGFVAGYTITQVLFDALTKAGSTDPNKLNTALGQTDKTYTLGHIQFGSNHADTLPSVMMQWQSGNLSQVYPKVAGVTLEVPTPGLA
jgi:branched-chain amino acid transport system substrate-binding protein